MISWISSWKKNNVDQQVSSESNSDLFLRTPRWLGLAIGFGTHGKFRGVWPVKKNNDDCSHVLLMWSHNLRVIVPFLFLGCVFFFVLLQYHQHNTVMRITIIMMLMIIRMIINLLLTTRCFGKLQNWWRSGSYFWDNFSVLKLLNMWE